MVVFGTRFFGWVDQVEGVGTVATRFFHVMWIPLVPLGTWFMLGDDRGTQIGLSVKSILVAWIRSFLFWSALGSFVAMPATFGITCIFAVPLAIAYFAMPLLVRRASSSRAEELRSLLR